MTGLRTCPGCATGWCSSYANGTWEQLYCQHCGYEAREPSTRNDTERVEIGPPAWTQDAEKRKIATKTKPAKKDWTK